MSHTLNILVEYLEKNVSTFSAVINCLRI